LNLSSGEVNVGDQRSAISHQRSAVGGQPLAESPMRLVFGQGLQQDFQDFGSLGFRMVEPKPTANSANSREKKIKNQCNLCVVWAGSAH